MWRVQWSKTLFRNVPPSLIALHLHPPNKSCFEKWLQSKQLLNSASNNLQKLWLRPRDCIDRKPTVWNCHIEMTPNSRLRGRTAPLKSMCRFTPGVARARLRSVSEASQKRKKHDNLVKNAAVYFLSDFHASMRTLCRSSAYASGVNWGWGRQVFKSRRYYSLHYTSHTLYNTILTILFILFIFLSISLITLCFPNLTEAFNFLEKKKKKSCQCKVVLGGTTFFWPWECLTTDLLNTILRNGLPIFSDCIYI